MRSCMCWRSFHDGRRYAHKYRHFHFANRTMIPSSFEPGNLAKIDDNTSFNEIVKAEVMMCKKREKERACGSVAIVCVSYMLSIFIVFKRPHFHLTHQSAMIPFLPLYYKILIVIQNVALIVVERMHPHWKRSVMFASYDVRHRLAVQINYYSVIKIPLLIQTMEIIWTLSLWLP